MDYTLKLTSVRPRVSSINGREIEEEYESNRGRIINSAPFRRLQKKAQVFSFESNAAVRSRMTHSLEVMQSGRYIARLIVDKILNRNEKNYETGFRSAFISAVEMACLLHDIGNPPFGHFGEAAINKWLEKNLAKCFQGAFKKYEGESKLKEKIFLDLQSFEGNAQAIRVVQKLQGMNLTYSQTASILKYTRGAFEVKQNINQKYEYLVKKPGYYLSEEEFITNLRVSQKMENYCRHPLAYIMEAADDISYCVSDLEDAVEKGIVDFSIIGREMKGCFESGSDAQKLIEKLLIEKKDANNYEKAIDFRTNVAKFFVPKAVEVFLENEAEIYHGTFNRPLLDEKNTPEGEILEKLKSIMRSHVFNNHEVETRELKGYSVIMGLMDIFSPLIEVERDVFEKLINKLPTGFDVESRLTSRLPAKYKEVYQTSVSAKPNAENSDIYEWYYRVRLIVDYISGMTDDFALKEYQELTGIGYLS